MRPQFLRDTITVEAYGGSGARGPVYGAPQIVRRVSVQPESKLIVDTQGRELMVEVSVIHRPGVSIPVESKVTLKDGRVFRVLKDEPQPDMAKPTHRELWLGSLQ